MISEPCVIVVPGTVYGIFDNEAAANKWAAFWFDPGYRHGENAVEWFRVEKYNPGRVQHKRAVQYPRSRMSSEMERGY